MIGGDVDAAGIYADALAVIQKGGLREAGIEEIGIGAYPEGHSRIPAGRLEAALDEKIAAATAQGLAVHIVSQFSFSPERILAWLRQLRACGISKPVKVGMAGPTSVPALLRYAKRCGVTASLRGLMSGAAASLIGHVGPDRILETLTRPPTWATPRRIISHSAVRLKPHAMHANPHVELTALAVLWLSHIKTRDSKAGFGRKQ